MGRSREAKVVSINGQAGMVEVAPPQPAKRTRIAIVGFADSWPVAPYHNETWEIWCLNQFYDLVGCKPDLTGGKVDIPKLAAEHRLRWFDLHPRHNLENDPNVISRHPHHLERLKQIGALGVPVYMHQVWEDMPGTVEYPIAAMTARFGDYWTNSVSYMIALAISEGATEIGLYGVNMAQDGGEYQQQRPSCEYFIGFARGLGITVHIPLQSDLLMAAYRYGYDDDKASKVQAKLDQMIADHRNRMVGHQKARDENDAYSHQFDGAIQQATLLKRIIGG